ncbi:MAG TPA: ABC transporter permease [Bauldia sp.]|nr:ABC transporter permease [Bauldia sp.]
MSGSARERADRAATVLVRIVIVLAVLFLLLPVVVGIAMSFDARSFLGPFPPKALSLRWYERFFSDPVFMRGLRVSVLLAVAATLVSTVIGVAAAVGLDRGRFPGRDALVALFLSPLIVPAVVIGFAMLLFYSWLGIGDGFLRLLGGHIVITFPYTLRATLAGLAGIRPSLVEAAMSLGATPRRAFFDVTLPLARTGIFAGAVLAFAFSFDEVAVSLFLADPQSTPLPVALVSMMRANFDLTVAAASTLLVGVTVVLILVLDRLVGIDRIVGQGVYRA